MLAADQAQASEYALTVIIAEEQAAANVQAIFAVLQPAAHPDVEFLLCTGSQAASEWVLPGAANLRIFLGTPGARIPLLWRDGIRAARAERVALTTAHCIPAPDWLERLESIQLEGALVAVGGAIQNVRGADALGRAIYALRYGNYTTSRQSATSGDLAADNALYLRAPILALDQLLEIGFWEPSFHERFLQAGQELRFDAGLRVVHHNAYAARAFWSQRYAHGMEFGLARAASMSTGKTLLMILLGPILPLVFLRKLLVRARGDAEIQLGFGSDLLWLSYFVFGWCLGEVIGYCRALGSGQRASGGAGHAG